MEKWTVKQELVQQNQELKDKEKDPLAANNKK